MSLRPIVQALGGDLYDRGQRANIPAPGHSAADRSVSLLLKEGRIIVHTFGDGDWRAVLDHLRGEGLVDAHNAPTTLSQSRRASSAGNTGTTIERLNAARRIWEAFNRSIVVPAFPAAEARRDWLRVVGALCASTRPSPRR